jgi:hypothetical protein
VARLQAQEAALGAERGELLERVGALQAGCERAAASEQFLGQQLYMMGLARQQLEAQLRALGHAPCTDAFDPVMGMPPPHMMPHHPHMHPHAHPHHPQVGPPACLPATRPPCCAGSTPRLRTWPASAG